MKQNEVQIGGVYSAKVSGNIVQVRIVRQNPRGGWDGLNLKTNKAVRIKSARRLRGVVSHLTVKPAKQLANSVPVANNPAKATKDTAPTKQRDTGEAVAPQAKRVATAEPITMPTKPLSLLNAAAIVLEACDRPLCCKEIIEKAVDAGIWKPGTGKTPANTLSAAIRREIKTKDNASRFQLSERGKFILNIKK